MNSLFTRSIVLPSALMALFALTSCAAEEGAKRDSSTTNSKKTSTSTSTSGGDDSTDPSNDDGSSDTSANAAKLVGVWSSCKSSELTNIKSAKVAYEFKQSGQLSLESKFFTDTKCSTSATENDLNTYVEDAKKYYEKQNITLNAEQIAAIKQEVTDSKVSVTYKVGKQLSSGVVELDLIGPAGTHYLAYKIQGTTLQLSSACTEEDIKAQFCKTLAGTTASNRSVSEFGVSLTKN